MMLGMRKVDNHMQKKEKDQERESETERDRENLLYTLHQNYFKMYIRSVCK
jgi:hypothetical protein